MWHSALCFLSTSAVPLRLGLQSVHAAKPRSCLQSLSWTGFARLPTAATPVSSDGSDPCVHPHTMKTSPAGKLAMGRELLNALVHYSCRKFAAASSRRVSQPGCHHGQQRNLIRGGMWMHAAHMQPTVATTHLLYPSFPRLATCPNLSSANRMPRPPCALCIFTSFGNPRPTWQSRAMVTCTIPPAAPTVNGQLNLPAPNIGGSQASLNASLAPNTWESQLTLLLSSGEYFGPKKPPGFCPKTFTDLWLHWS